MVSTGKIFGIGVPKTGTTSLGLALEMLGFNHKSYDQELNHRYDQGDCEPIFRETENYETFEDAPWNREILYRELDQRFPGSKFILTIREMQSWLKSHEKHYAAKRLQERPQEIWMRKLYDEKRKDKLIQWHQSRTENVFKYFEDRPNDLLVIDICGGGDSWEKLCPFLGLPIPVEPFPRANAAPKSYSATLDIWKKTMKRTIKQMVGQPGK